MGGTNETLIDGLRFHVNGTAVHIHDDNKKLKFESTTTDFSKQVTEVLKELESADGIVKISGLKDDLCIVSDNKKVSLFLTPAIPAKSVRPELDKFLQSI